MAKLQPWYKVITPREDLREERPLDAAEFAVHLDKVRIGQARQIIPILSVFSSVRTSHKR